MSMTLNDHNTMSFPYVFYSWAYCVELNEVRPILSAAKDRTGL